MSIYKVSAISFYNTLPFVYGLNNNSIINEIELSVDSPAECANKLMAGTVDIGLVPIVEISKISHSQIFSNYCIGTNGSARTVILASNVQLNEIREIVLDYQSRTSVILAQILAKKFWHIDVSYKMGYSGFENTEIKGNTAAVVIGNKVFPLEKKFKYVYDLSDEWKKYTTLPFVFACWVTNRSLDPEFVKKFEKAIKYGIGHIREASLTAKLNDFTNHKSIEDYLRNNMNFVLDDRKKEAMQLFLSLAQEIKL